MLPMDGVLVVVGYFGPTSKRLSLNKCANNMIPCLIYALVPIFGEVKALDMCVLCGLW